MHRTARIDLVAQVLRPDVTPLELGPLATPVPAPAWGRFAPRPPGVVSRMMGGVARYEQAEAEARARYEQAVEVATRQEADRQRRVAALRQEHVIRVAQAEQDWQRRATSVEAHVRDIAARDQEAVELYLKHVLLRVPLPADFPRDVDVTFNPRTDQVIVQVELPPHDVVPTVSVLFEAQGRKVG